MKTIRGLDRTKLHIFSDFDGTITEKDTLVFLAERLGGGVDMVRAIGRLIQEGKISLRDGIAAEMRSIRVPFDEAVKLLRDEVAIDSGFAGFSSWCREAGVPLTVVSAGFHEIIDLFLPESRFPDLEILANRLRPGEASGWQCEFRDKSEFGHDKSRLVHSARTEGFYTVFVGDGLSDRAPAEVADEVFAKHTLAEYCQSLGINCLEFSGFDDVHRNLKERLV